MTALEAGIPPLPPYIAAEAAEGAAYRALPSPKASVLNAVTNTVTDLNTRFTKVTIMAGALSCNSSWLHRSLVISHGWITVLPSQVQLALGPATNFELDACSKRGHVHHLHDTAARHLKLLFDVQLWRARDWHASHVHGHQSRLEHVCWSVLRVVSAGLQTIATVRADVSDYNAQVISKIVTLHNNTVDEVNRKIDQYLPQVRKYDHM